MPPPGSFAALREAADRGLRDSSLVSYVPESFTWTDLAEELAQPSHVTPQRVLALHACLATPSRLQDATAAEDDSATARRRIRQHVAQAMAPLLDCGEYTEMAQDLDDPARHAVLDRCRDVADAAVAVLQAISDPPLSPTDADDVQVVASLAAAADSGQPWTTQTTSTAARTLLQDITAADSDAWTMALLQGYVRPLFAQGARPVGVTAAGRATQFHGGPAARSTDTETRAAKPWKYSDLRAISAVAWAVKSASLAHWSLFTPALLTLVDDPDVDVRARGLGLLTTFLARLPDSRVLRDTGLDRVLADAVRPTLLFLPDLTPIDESLRLLTPAYDVLLQLATLPATTRTAASSTALDQLLRDGILAGYFHASTHMRIVALLAHEAARIVTAMGINAVRHLKDLLPLCAAVLTDPFATRYPPALAAAIELLQAVLASCWPRLSGPPWAPEVTRMLVLCWLHVDEDCADAARPALQAALQQAAATLVAILQAADAEVEAQIGPLVAQEPRLTALFRGK